MYGSHRPLAASLAALALLLAAPAANGSPASRRASRTARIAKAHVCTKAPVEIVAGNESAAFPLARCDGSAVSSGVDQLSLLAWPGSVPKSKGRLAAAGKGGTTPAPPGPAGARRVDPRLVERLELVVDHFRKGDVTPRVLLVSGYRPRSSGSYHAKGRALDFRIEGVTNEALVAFCKTLPDTGCGYYPNSVFVHMDTREPGTGHVAWIDASRPGEAPRYVSSWPPSSTDAVDNTLPPLPADEHASAAEDTVPPTRHGGDTDEPSIRRSARSF